MNLTQRLDLMIRNETIPHALLFVGGNDAKEMAYRFAHAVISQGKESLSKKLEHHPDIHQYLPAGKVGLHPVSSLRDLSEKANLSPFEASWKIFILHDAERMLPASANALLKILEEPPAHTLFLLVTRHLEKILATVRSRCQVIEFSHVRDSSSEVLEWLGGKLSRVDFEKKVTDTQDPLFQSSFLVTIMRWFRDRELLELGEEAKSYLSFPDWIPFIQNSPRLPLEYVEKTLKKMRLALERSIKFSQVLEILSLTIEAF